MTYVEYAGKQIGRIILQEEGYYGVIEFSCNREPIEIFGYDSLVALVEAMVAIYREENAQENI